VAKFFRQSMLDLHGTLAYLAKYKHPSLFSHVISNGNKCSIGLICLLDQHDITAYSAEYKML
jgi:hypothetical protein